MPRYEYTEGTSNKFWEIELAGSSYTVKWGRIGGSVSTSTKKLGDAGKAKQAYDKLIAEKTGKGYALVGTSGSRSQKPASKPASKPGTAKLEVARDPKLEQAILANPDDPDAYLVYADWLQTRNDPRGELIVLQHANKTRAANTLLAKHAEAFLGPLAKREPPRLEATWRWGFIERLVIGWDDFEYDGVPVVKPGKPLKYGMQSRAWAEACKAELVAVLEHPSARFLRELEVGPIPGEEQMDLTPAAEAVEQVAPACLRSLRLGRRGNWDISSTSTATPASKSIKRLERLWLEGGEVAIGTLDLPELRELRVWSGSLTASALRAIAAAKLPKLETLEIWFGDPNYGASGGVSDIAPILAGKKLPRLVHLKLKNCPFADALVEALSTAPILRRVKTLDLSMGNLSDRGIDRMVASKKAFAHLDALDLDDNALTEVSKGKLAGLAAKVHYGRQDSPERAVPRATDNRYRRYVAVGE